MEVSVHLFSNTRINPLSNDKFFRQVQIESNMQTTKISVTLKQKFFLGWMKNIVGKGENVGYQKIPACSPFPIMFSKGLFFRVV